VEGKVAVVVVVPAPVCAQTVWVAAPTAKKTKASNTIILRMLGLLIDGSDVNDNVGQLGDWNLSG
jgi:hypothetical protein